METRENLIQRYEKIKEKWDNDEDLRRILPDTYEEICMKLDGLKKGYKYSIKNVTEECVMAGGALLCGGQQGFANPHNGKIMPFAYSQKYQDGLRRFLRKCEL